MRLDPGFTVKLPVFVYVNGPNFLKYNKKAHFHAWLCPGHPGNKGCKDSAGKYVGALTATPQS